VVSIAGSGFSAQLASNTVLFGGTRARVLSVVNNSMLVALAPRMSAGDESNVSAEQLLFSSCQSVNASLNWREWTPGSLEAPCSDNQTDGCALLWGIPLQLVDGNPDTVWRSDTNIETQKLDLGRVTPIVSLRIHWYAAFLASRISVSLAVSCVNTSQRTPVNNISNISKMDAWDQVSVVQFPDNTYARFVA
jgi:hypothetical protein